MDAGWGSAICEALEATERTWIGVEADPLPRRLAAAGWRPDEPDEYCPRCGGDAGPFEAGAAGCPRCRAARLPWTRCVRLGRYEGVLRDVVHEVKFTAWRSLGTAIGRELGRSIARAADADGSLRGVPVRIVPVPTSLRRRMARGIDHSLVLARGAARELPGARVWPLLARAHRPSQVSVPASQRRKNVAGTIRVTGGARMAHNLGRIARIGAAATGGRVLVVVLDDVRTTGATLRAAAGPVRMFLEAEGRAEAVVWTAVVAVTPEQDRSG